MANTSGTDTKRFYRYPDDGPLGGVCAGVARYANVDANIVRLGAIVLAVMGPGIPAYILAWIFLPEGDGTVHADKVIGKTGSRWSQAVGIGLIIVAVSVMWGDWWWPGRGWVLPLALIAFGGWLLFRDTDDEGGIYSVAPAPPAPPAGATEVTSDTTSDDTTAGEAEDTDVLSPVDGADGDGDPPDAPTAALPPAPPPSPRARRRRVLGPLVFGALLVWGGVAWLAGLDARDGLAIGLCILGAGFVLGAFIGGTKVLVLPALLMGAALVCVSVIDIPLHGGIGDREWDVERVRDLDDEYELAIGSGVLDLSRLNPGSRTIPEIDVSVGIGELEIIVPEGAEVTVDVEVGAGEYDVLGHSDDGVGLDLERTRDGDPGSDRFVINAHVGLGDLQIREGPAR
jgi:phage shock protein PspC (stress-responsive transcriptional regulator)